MKATITCVGVALLAGCACEPPIASPDASFDVGRDAVDASVDVGRDAPIDAYVPPDAFVPLVLTELDPSACTPPAPLPPRARALPADSTPRILWTRSIRELGIGGGYLNIGAVDHNGDLHFSVLSAQLRGGEVSRTGDLLGYGTGFERTKGPSGALTILPDESAAEWSNSSIRIDESPPREVPRSIWWPHNGDPDERTIGVAMAATSDGLYAYRGYGNGTLRKYCADGRLQWELSGVTSTYFQVDDDDSVWIRRPDGPDEVNVRVDRHGSVVEAVDGYVDFAGTSRWISTLDADGETVTHRRVVGGVELDRIVSDRPVRPDPFGGAWVQVGPSTADWVHHVDGVDVGRLTAYINGAPVGEDGSFLVREISASDEYSLARVLPTGEVAWRLSVPLLGYITHDIDGRVYLYGGDQIVAVQTDVLPPNVRGCWQHRCNPLANMSIAPYPG
jgi:hypothetical protein